jgi:hypothetical protein
MGQEITEGGLLSPKLAAARACVSVSLIYQWCADGSLPHLRVGAWGRRGKILIAPADLDALLAGFKVSGSTSSIPAASVPAASGSPVGPFSELDPKRLVRAWKTD